MSDDEGRMVEHQGYRWDYAAALRRLAQDAEQLAGEITAGRPVPPPPWARWNAVCNRYGIARDSRP